MTTWTFTSPTPAGGKAATTVKSGHVDVSANGDETAEMALPPTLNARSG